MNCPTRAPTSTPNAGERGQLALFRSASTLDVGRQMREAGMAPRDARREPCDSVFREFSFLSYLEPRCDGMGGKCGGRGADQRPHRAIPRRPCAALDALVHGAHGRAFRRRVRSARGRRVGVFRCDTPTQRVTASHPAASPRRSRKRSGAASNRRPQIACPARLGFGSPFFWRPDRAAARRSRRRRPSTPRRSPARPARP